MMADMTLKVEITGESVEGGGTTTDPTPDTVEKPTEDTVTKKGSAGKTYISLSAVKNTGKQLLTTVASHVGEITGDSDKQAKVNAALSLAGEIGTTAAAYAANIAAGVVVTVQNAIRHASDMFSYGQRSMWGGIEMNLTRERLGGSATYNHSR